MNRAVLFGKVVTAILCCAVGVQADPAGRPNRLSATAVFPRRLPLQERIFRKAG